MFKSELDNGSQERQLLGYPHSGVGYLSLREAAADESYAIIYSVLNYQTSESHRPLISHQAMRPEDV